MWEHPHGQWLPFLTAALSLSLSTLCSLHGTKQQPALASNWKWAFPCKLSTQQLIVLLLTMLTNSADYPIAEQADQLEHRIKVGLSRLLAAFTAHYQKGVHIRVPIRKEQHCLPAWLRCQASKAVTTQRRPDKLLGIATLPNAHHTHCMLPWQPPFLSSVLTHKNLSIFLRKG